LRSISDDYLEIAPSDFPAGNFPLADDSLQDAKLKVDALFQNSL